MPSQPSVSKARKWTPTRRERYQSLTCDASLGMDVELRPPKVIYHRDQAVQRCEVTRFVREDTANSHRCRKNQFSVADPTREPGLFLEQPSAGIIASVRTSDGALL